MAAKKTAMSFEQSLDRLEEIVRHLEKGDLPLSDSLALYEEGTALIAACSKQLDEAEQKVVKLKKGADGEPVDCHAGYAQAERRYDSRGNVTFQRLLTAEEVLSGVIQPSAEYAYDSAGNVILERWLDASGRPVAGPGGWLEVRTVWDAAGLMREITNISEDGTGHRTGFDSDGRVISQALLDADGRVWQGCNIENAAFGPTVCAERVALFKAVSEGVRSFEALAVVGGPAGEGIAPYTPPCGVCRQVLREFCSDGFRVILASPDGSLRTTTLGELLPQGFGPENLS